MSLCKHCVSGVTHEGTPEGKWEKINGVDAYVATPTVEYPKNKVLLFLTDIFGPQLINNQLLADDYARNGFRTVIPDWFNGDPVGPDALHGNTGFNLGDWFAKHGPAETRAPLDKVIAALKAEGVTEFGITAYCFGARYAFDLAFEGFPKVIVTCHPSLLKFPEDIEKYSKTNIPILINSCTTDPQFPISAQEITDSILGNGKFTPGYKRPFFEGCTHGFAVRGDLSDPKVKAGKEGAFKENVEWLIAHL